MLTGCVGPRFDGIGNILPHSILGSVEDFKKEAIHVGHLPVSVSARTLVLGCHCVMIHTAPVRSNQVKRYLSEMDITTR